VSVGRADATSTVPSGLSGSTMAKGLAPTRSSVERELDDAGQPQLHRTHIALLAQSRHRVVREAIARRGDVPLGVQAALANDDWYEVRAAMAANPRAAWSVMDAASRDRHHLVVLALISNPSLPHEIAHSLVEHRRQEVRDALAQRLRTSPPVKHTAEPVEDRLIPELRERAASWADHAGLSKAYEVPGETGFGLDEERAASLGAQARAAAPVASGQAVPVVQDEPVAQGALPASSAPVFEPEPDDPLEYSGHRPAVGAYPEHDFLVVSLPTERELAHAAPSIGFGSSF